MPIHDWTRVEAGIFHDFHHAWIEETKRALNSGLLPDDKPLTLVAYESSLNVKAYIEPVAVGDELPFMPLILESGWAVNVPLEQTYHAAWRAFPRRWRLVLNPLSA